MEYTHLTIVILVLKLLCPSDSPSYLFSCPLFIFCIFFFCHSPSAHLIPSDVTPFPSHHSAPPYSQSPEVPCSLKHLFPFSSSSQPELKHVQLLVQIVCLCFRVFLCGCYLCVVTSVLWRSMTRLGPPSDPHKRSQRWELHTDGN